MIYRTVPTQGHHGLFATTTCHYLASSVTKETGTDSNPQIMEFIRECVIFHHRGQVRTVLNNNSRRRCDLASRRKLIAPRASLPRRGSKRNASQVHGYGAKGLYTLARPYHPAHTRHTECSTLPAFRPFQGFRSDKVYNAYRLPLPS